jgi:hypothetical protein
VITLEDPDKKYPLKLIEKKVISHDTRLFRHLFTAGRVANVLLKFSGGKFINLTLEVRGKCRCGIEDHYSQ